MEKSEKLATARAVLAAWERTRHRSHPTAELASSAWRPSPRERPEACVGTDPTGFAVPAAHRALRFDSASR
ncbi:MAG TPA: hypothetical protein VJV78_02060 [Polyangiales bacterium]|nr:hypothetical protein [Polyangiales bacterium]